MQLFNYEMITDSADIVNVENGDKILYIESETGQ